MDSINYILDKYQLHGQASPIGMNCSRKITLPRIFKNLGFGVGVEVGVERGVYSKVLVREIPGLKLYGVDPWQFYLGYREHVPQERLDEFFRATKERLKDYDYQIIRDTSMNAVKRFADNSIDFVYIDGNHTYDFVKEDIREWHKKVRKGGIVAGHDYGNNVYMQSGGQKQVMRVKQAVDEWVAENKIEYLFLLTKGDKYPSWLYVKE